MSLQRPGVGLKQQAHVAAGDGADQVTSLAEDGHGAAIVLLNQPKGINGGRINLHTMHRTLVRQPERLQRLYEKEGKERQR